MKKVFLLSVAASLICSLSFATIRRVGFFGPAVSGVDYTTLQLAHNAATAGDTIMMMPGSEVGGSISKTLVIIGPGYLLNPADVSFPGNAQLQANLNPNSVNTFSSNQLFFLAGSSNSQVIGCSLYTVDFNAVGLSGILIKRCRIPTISGAGLYFRQAASNISLQQCLFNSTTSLQFDGNGTVYANIGILNCIFDSRLLMNPNVSISGLIMNSIFVAGSSSEFYAGNWQVSNCIAQGFINGTNMAFNNNIGTSTQFPSGNGNQQNKTWVSIFNLTGSYDGKYALKAGSPAIGAGINGAVATDCGIFGGATPYRLSGIPSVPTIYSLTSPQGTIPAGNSVQINVSTRSNN